MKHTLILLLFLFFWTITSNAQSYDSIKVSSNLRNKPHLDCTTEKTTGLFKGKQRKLLGIDSTLYCRLIKTYITDNKNVFYVKEFDIDGKLRSEGFMKKLKGLVKDGNWKSYDNNGKKTFDGYYKNGQICSGYYSNGVIVDF